MVAGASVLLVMWLMLRNYSVMQIDYTPENFLLPFSFVPFRFYSPCVPSLFHFYTGDMNVNGVYVSCTVVFGGSINVFPCRIISVHQICFV